MFHSPARLGRSSRVLLLGLLAGCHGFASGSPAHRPAAAVAPHPHESVCSVGFEGPRDPAATEVAPARTLIHAGRLFDGVSAEARRDVEILIEGDHIVSIGGQLDAGADVRHIDLRHASVLPGLIDAHTHLLHQGGDDYVRALVGASIPARVLAASAAARLALSHGFTSLRDVETEGAMYADVDLKRAINAGTLLGPRLWVSTRGISTVGRYQPLGASWELDLPTGAQLVVGEVEGRAAVREQVGRGADWIKVYADYFPVELDADGHIRGPLNFTDAELRAIVDEAHRLDRRVAAHAMTHDGIAQALSAGVDSIEHAHGLSEELAQIALEKGVFVCPTLLAEHQFIDVMPPDLRAVLERGYENLAHAHRIGVKLVYGTDLGSIPWSVNGAAGLALYEERLRMTPAEVLRAATVRGAELLGQEGALGQITPSSQADLIAVAGDPLADIHELENVIFVMKGGQVVVSE